METDPSRGENPEAAFEVSEQRWRSLVDHAPSIITVVKADLTIEYINRPVPGLAPEEVVGRNVLDFIQPEFHQLAEEKIRYVLETGEPASYISQATGPDGSVAWYDNQLGPLMIEGRVDAVTFFATDITPRMIAEEALRESEEKFRILFDLSPYSMVLSDLEGTIEICNHQFTELHATREGPETQVGRNVADFFPEDQRPLLEATIGKMIMEGGPPERVQYTMLKEDGTEFHAEAISSVGKSPGPCT